MLEPNDVNDQFFEAVKNGQLSKVQKLINDYGLSYLPDWLDGYKLLCEATQHEQREVAKLLLRNGSAVNSKNGPPPSMYPLHYAVKNDDVELVKMLLNKGAHVDIKASDGSTPLLIALRRNYLHIIYLLLNHGVAFDVASTSWNKPGKTLLHFASAKSHKNLINLLLLRHADVNARDRNGSTPFHDAVKSGNSEVFQCLLFHGADINAKNLKNQTPLSLAVDTVSLTTVRIILSYKPDSSDEYNRLALCSAVKSAHISHFHSAPSVKERNSRQIVKNLLGYGFAIKPHDVADTSLLYAAVKNGCGQILENLLIYGADVNYSENTTRNKSPLLHTAINKGQDSIVQLLIKYGADVNSKDENGHTPMYFAIATQNPGIAMQLLDNKAVVGSGYDLLCLAIGTENTKTIETVLSFNDVDINATNSSGTTALHIAVQHRRTRYPRGINSRRFSPPNTVVKKTQSSTVQLLIKHGADVNSKDKNGRTPMYLAIQEKKVGIAMQLLDNKAVVESSFDLLCLAIETKDTKTIVKMLTFDGVDINATSSSGITALYVAIGYAQTEMIKFLLDKGANVNHVNANGETALSKACRLGYNEILEILLEFGAKTESERTRYAIPLHAATKNNDEKIVEILLRYDAYIDFKNDDGETALHIAFQNKSVDVIDMLLEHGSDINSMTKSKFTAFDSASSDQLNWPDGMIDFGFLRKRTVIKCLQRHMIKLKAANLYSNEKNFCSMDSSAFKNFRTICEKEIQNMKSEKIVNNISFYDILTKEMNKLMVYSRNENIMQVLKTNDYRTKFPTYAGMINLRFKKGMKRYDLLEQSYRFFDILSDSLPVFPHDCIDDIFNYLSNYDLKNLIKACK